jgi:hypothetical protein
MEEDGEGRASGGRRRAAGRSAKAAVRVGTIMASAAWIATSGNRPPDPCGHARRASRPDDPEFGDAEAGIDVALRPKSCRGAVGDLDRQSAVSGPEPVDPAAKGKITKSGSR